ncbi:hypothetical protein [Deinococcus aquiradiocola]|uniref:Uncharacterized protein n=1 Tax=Deinococcus aquiradiocola TaxID=393059 RepID=A0A917PH42_9DEIO|nr:hypothetical protein [Deinococcus aquiradiocola]GGJ77836.1 hypothetical protein GCM10008939_22320 [Deinococcus aquiradiocola]
MTDSRTDKIDRAVAALLARLPEGTLIRWEDRQDPPALVLTASQPHPQPDRAYRGAVRILAQAEADEGLGVPLADALRVLKRLASRHSLPVVRAHEAVPVVAVWTLTGLEQQDPPLRG